MQGLCEKTPVQSKHSACLSLVITRVATDTFNFRLFALDGSRMPTVGFFEDFYFFVPNSFFTAGFFDRYSTSFFS
jgi:hypothetical protein